MGVLSEFKKVLTVAQLTAGPVSFGIPNGVGSMHLVLTPLDAEGEPIDPTGTPVTGDVTVKVRPSGSRYYQDLLNEADDIPLTIVVGEVKTYPINASISGLTFTVGTAIANCESVEVKISHLG